VDWSYCVVRRPTHANKSDCRRIIHSPVFLAAVLTELILIVPSPNYHSSQSLVICARIWNAYFVQYSNLILQRQRYHETRNVTNRPFKVAHEFHYEPNPSNPKLKYSFYLCWSPNTISLPHRTKHNIKLTNNLYKERKPKSDKYSIAGSQPQSYHNWNRNSVSGWQLGCLGKNGTQSLMQLCTLTPRKIKRLQITPYSLRQGKEVNCA